ncbi:hypothetical protein DRJ19_01290 [Candidatus Woesearchaeota archaeon]|nr:MAG: hypothetical protein DRJ19_01290 [Candidatus Woesearchaeota archaeon]
MQEKTLVSFSVIAIVLGLLLFYFLTQSLEPNKISIYKLEEKPTKMLGKSVSIEGVVSKIEQKERIAIITLLEPKETKVVVFKNKPNLDIKEGDYISVDGKIESFQNKTQIIAYKIIRK